jgi:molybdopterin molybdotransferase
MIDVAEAEARINALVRRTDAERIPLAAASGRILREPVTADRDLPPFNRVMMDGYAIRRRNNESVSEYRICGSALAGSPQQVLPADESVALEVMTGAPLPEGADTVVPFEDTERDGNQLRITDPEVETGQFIHRQASDHAQGARLLQSGVLLRSVEIGIAASCGYAELCVARKPSLAVFGTGDELVPVGETPRPASDSPFQRRGSRQRRHFRWGKRHSLWTLVR